MLGRKANLYTFGRIEIIQRMFFDHIGKKLQINETDFGNSPICVN